MVSVSRSVSDTAVSVGLVAAFSACSPNAPATSAASGAPPSRRGAPTTQVSWSSIGDKAAGGGFVIDLARARWTATRCDAKDAPQWATDDVVSCNRADGTSEVHDLSTDRTLELNGPLATWDKSGRYALFSLTDPHPRILDRALGVAFAIAFEANRDPPTRMEWVGRGTVLRAWAGDQGQLWDAATRASVGLAYDVGFFGLWSTAPSGAYVLELIPVRGENPGPMDAAKAYLIEADTGARHELVGGVSLHDNFPDGLPFFSPDSTTVAVPIAHTGVQLFDTNTRASTGLLIAPPCTTPLQIAWSPSGDEVAVGDDTMNICLFDAKTKEFLRSWTTPVGRSKKGEGVLGLGFFADGSGVFVRTMSDEGEGEGSAWEVSTSKAIALEKVRGTFQVHVSSNREALFDDVLIDAHLAVHEASECGGASPFRGVREISLQGRYVWGSRDDSGRCRGLQTIDVPLPTFENGDGVDFASMSPDGSKVLGYIDDEPRVWDLITGKQLFP